MSDKTKILVTGASGFVGRTVVFRLFEEKQYEITAMTGQKNINNVNEEKKDYKICRADITNYKGLREKLGGNKFDIIVHSAGLAHQFGKTVKEKFYEINVKGTENICKMAVASKAKLLILLSSVAVYGNYGKKTVDESFECMPNGFYAESKYEAEKKALQICRENNINLVILRLGTVIGEDDPGNLARLIKTIDRGKFLWIGNGHNKKSFIYKKDVGEAIVKIIENKGQGAEIFNLTANQIEIRTIVELIEKKLQRRVPGWSLSPKIFSVIGKFNEKTISSFAVKELCNTVEKWIADDKYSSQKFDSTYCFKAQTEIEEAINKQITYYLETKQK